MRVTIITVCFNSAKTIEKTILSIANQTYSDIEYIIIDGMSTDNTIEIIRKYESSISIWISEPDRGLYDAMNKGIDLASGSIIGILNSDDVFYSASIISNIVDFHKNNDIDASIGNVVQHNIDEKLIRFYSAKYWKPEMLRFGFMPPHPSIFIKRELFKYFGKYDLGFKIGSDYELITRFFLKNKIRWMYSGVTTTSMLIGGLSSSGLSSYYLISKEIHNALFMNKIKHSKWIISLRFIWKIFDLKFTK